MKSFEKKVPVSAAILLGSILISFSILLSGGIISIKGLKGIKEANVAAAPQQPSQPQGKTEADIIAALKSYASKAGVNQQKFDSCLDSGQQTAAVTTDLNEGSQAGVNGTPAFFLNGYLIGGAQPYSVFKDAIDFTLKGGNWKSPDESVKYLVDGNPNNGEIGTEKVTVGVGNLPARGSANAAVTLVEFSDYECPFCSRFYTQAELQLKKDYIDTGKVKFYYRDFPLTQIHPGAQKGAEAARCAADQGKYWEYHDLVFENQDSIFR